MTGQFNSRQLCFKKYDGIEVGRVIFFFKCSRGGSEFFGSLV